MTKKLLIALLAFISFSVTAKENIRIVVPFAAGGPTDVLARAVEQSLIKYLPGYTPVIEYKPGGGGIIGIRAVATNKEKETVLLVVSSSIIINSIRPDAGYNIKQDFVPVAYLGAQEFSLVTNKKGPVNLRDLLTTDRSKELFFGSAGVGSGSHIAGEILKSSTGLQLTHVPYKGEAPAITDLIAGNINLMFTGTGNALKYSDTLRILASNGQRRDPQLPGVPTLQEIGVAGFENPIQLSVVYANQTADLQLVKKIQQALVKSLTNPKDVVAYNNAGVEVNPKKITKFDDIIDSAVARVTPLAGQLQ
jgi:tripartite-type tricarboxylate transporter receptor subunit TctC